MNLRQPLILASQSPRRRSLLQEAGYVFRVIPSALHEPDEFPAHVPPSLQAEALAYFKAREVSQKLQGSGLVLGADTLIAKGGRIFGKAHDAEEARRHLAELSGSTHEVITGVALLDLSQRSRQIRHAVTKIVMRRMTEEQIEAYVTSGAWQDKAGAYAIQEGGDAFIERIEGSFTNVVGLPMELVAELLLPYLAENEPSPPTARDGNCTPSTETCLG